MSTNFVGSLGLPFEMHTKVMSMMMMMMMRMRIVTVLISTEINRKCKDVDGDCHQITKISKIGQPITTASLQQVVSCGQKKSRGTKTEVSRLNNIIVNQYCTEETRTSGFMQQLPQQLVAGKKLFTNYFSKIMVKYFYEFGL